MTCDGGRVSGESVKCYGFVDRYRVGEYTAKLAG